MHDMQIIILFVIRILSLHNANPSIPHNNRCIHAIYGEIIVIWG